MTNLIITTPEDLARIFEEVLARHQPPANQDAGLMKLETPEGKAYVAKLEKEMLV